MQHVLERRVQRSNDVRLAIELQLVAAAKRAQFSSLVLADAMGSVIAACGSDEINDQMAALSLRVAPKDRPWRGKVLTSRGTTQLTVVALHLGCGPFFLCAADGLSEIALEAISTSQQGIHRILAADVTS
jgi:hypothetical protein